MSGDFSEDPIRSLQLYFTRQARIRTLLFQGKTQYIEAFNEMYSVFSSLASLKGLYFFNFAAIIPYICTDQIQLIQTGFAQGATADKESFQINISQQKQKVVQDDNMADDLYGDMFNKQNKKKTKKEK